ncbi:MAG: 30S ribosomal protein S2 [Halobacteriovoraceae bacterium]|nr:30S ribosomal protein S2 [Halobacteriovoraceae bacterium]|tara:strand:- start:217 stop:1014 length:798 start_codon:yes stop_codon:yes gene_type:complete
MSNELTLQNLLEAGAHFGHQTHKWNPKMKQYIFGERNGIYIVDLAKTIPLAKKAYDFMKKVSSEGKPILFVGTKRQASETVKMAAKDCGAYYITHRWLGGMLTNFKTIALSIDKLRKVEKMKETGDFELLTKKERSKIDKDVIKLERNLGGIKDMRKLPGAIFVVDPNNERIAIREANTLGIPVIAVTDTNCDPEGVDFVVPGNDDAIKSIVLFTSYFSNSVVEGGSVAASKSKKAGQTKVERDAALEKEIISKYENDIDLKEEE